MSISKLVSIRVAKVTNFHVITTKFFLAINRFFRAKTTLYLGSPSDLLSVDKGSIPWLCP